MEITRLELQFCPQCGYSLDAHTNTTGDGAPEVGDISVCIECASLLRFDSDLKVQLTSMEELPESCHAQVAKVIEVVKAFRRAVPRKSPIQTS
jgi:hypothetical protein